MAALAQNFLLQLSKATVTWKDEEMWAFQSLTQFSIRELHCILFWLHVSLWSLQNFNSINAIHSIMCDAKNSSSVCSYWQVQAEAAKVSISSQRNEGNQPHCLRSTLSCQREELWHSQTAWSPGQVDFWELLGVGVQQPSHKGQEKSEVLQ